jgi:hypothetical protein
MTSIAWTLDTDLFFQPQSASAMESVEEAKWREIGEEIRGFRSCRNNWDGLGADAPNPDIIDRAITFVELARKLFSDRPPIRAALGPNGTVAIEWRDKSGVCYEAEFDADPEIHWMAFDGKNQPIHWDLEVPEKSAAREDQDQIRGSAWRTDTITGGDVREFASAA